MLFDEVRSCSNWSIKWRNERFWTFDEFVRGPIGTLILGVDQAAMYELFTDRTRKVMDFANQEANRLKHEYLGTEHILLGLIKEGRGVAAVAIKNLGFDLHRIRDAIENISFIGPRDIFEVKRTLTPQTKRVIECATEEMRYLGHSYLGTEHILLGILREKENVAAQILMNFGMRLEAVRAEVLDLLGHLNTERRDLQ